MGGASLASFFSASLFMSICHLVGTLDGGKGDIVVLRVPAAEILHPVDDGLHQKIDALGAGLPEHILELLLAKFVAFVVQRFVNSISINHNGVEWCKFYCN